MLRAEVYDDAMRVSKREGGWGGGGRAMRLMGGRGDGEGRMRPPCPPVYTRIRTKIDGRIRDPKLVLILLPDKEARVEQEPRK